MGHNYSQRQMKILILSTDTLHHAYFINRISKKFPVTAVFYETRQVKFAFETFSPFCDDEKRFEDKMFCRNSHGVLPDGLKLHKVKDVNSLDCIKLIKKYKPDVGISFGTGKIEPRIFSLFKYGIINVHRGIVNRYRGLDSELWAIYHNDFNNIGVTIHFVEKELDKGGIFKMERIKFSKSDKIFHLRYKTTILAEDMVRGILANFDDYNKKIVSQKRSGRYYSAMPSVLKPVCRDKFARFIKSYGK